MCFCRTFQRYPLSDLVTVIVADPTEPSVVSKSNMLIKVSAFATVPVKAVYLSTLFFFSMAAAKSFVTPFFSMVAKARHFLSSEAVNNPENDLCMVSFLRILFLFEMSICWLLTNVVGRRTWSRYCNFASRAPSQV